MEDQRGATTVVLERLKVHLHQDPNAKASPIEIKPRKLRTVIEKPTVKSSPEPALNREDVLGLVEFIEQYARQFEVTPRTYERMGEEELRDLLLGMMNANYPGSTSGGTFSKSILPLRLPEVFLALVKYPVSSVPALNVQH